MFYNRYLEGQRELLAFPLEQFTENHVLYALNKDRMRSIDLLALLSPAALPYLEQMAYKANLLTVQYFGRTIGLFAPLYLANFCTNHCAYCSYNLNNQISRRKLTLGEVKEEGEAIAATGLQHLLLLTGESRTHSGPDYLEACVRILRRLFVSIGIEVNPLQEAEYKQLYSAGVDALTMFQEVYDEEIYAQVHPAGPKRNYQYRLEAPERACAAGIPSINIGALLGLGDWRSEAFFTALHAEYLQQHHPDVELAVSVPRLRPHVGSFRPHNSLVTDIGLVQVILAYRLYLPRVGITLSTRENAGMRDSLLPLGITKMSAGALTTVGGYDQRSKPGSSQFEIADQRSVDQVSAMLRSKGYQPVFSDWINTREERAAAG